MQSPQVLKAIYALEHGQSIERMVDTLLAFGISRREIDALPQTVQEPLIGVSDAGQKNWVPLAERIAKERALRSLPIVTGDYLRMAMVGSPKRDTVRLYDQSRRMSLASARPATAPATAGPAPISPPSPQEKAGPLAGTHLQAAPLSRGDFATVRPGTLLVPQTRVRPILGPTASSPGLSASILPDGSPDGSQSGTNGARALIRRLRPGVSQQGAGSKLSLDLARASSRLAAHPQLETVLSLSAGIEALRAALNAFLEATQAFEDTPPARTGLEQPAAGFDGPQERRSGA